MASDDFDLNPIPGADGQNSVAGDMLRYSPANEADVADLEALVTYFADGDPDLKTIEGSTWNPADNIGADEIGGAKKVKIDTGRFSDVVGIPNTVDTAVVNLGNGSDELTSEAKYTVAKGGKGDDTFNLVSGVGDNVPDINIADGQEGVDTYNLEVRGDLHNQDDRTTTFINLEPGEALNINGLPLESANLGKELGDVEGLLAQVGVSLVDVPEPETMVDIECRPVQVEKEFEASCTIKR